MLLVACGLLFFQDPLLNYFNTWSTYNTWMWNRGSWVQDIPGWRVVRGTGRHDGRTVPDERPRLLLRSCCARCSAAGSCARPRARWPNISTIGLIGVVIAWTFFFDFVIEGLFLMPMGLFTYPGAIQSLSINAGTYYQWPLYEGLMWGGVQAGLCCLRYFTDDRGRTFVERGLDQVRGGFVKQQLIRFLAIFAACSAFFFVFYNIPAQFFAMHQDPWPEDILKRSYFLMGICGEGTDRPCPDPALPMPRRIPATSTPTVSSSCPTASSFPTNVPLERGK